jgi:hypothetical protein
MTLLVGCYLWSDGGWSENHAKGFRYGPKHVRHLKDAVKEHLTAPHEFICITDDPDKFDLDADIRAVKLDTTCHVPGKEWAKWMTFHPDGQNLFGGERMLQLDLDAVICGNIDHLVWRDEDIVCWRNPARQPYLNPAKYTGRAYYNGSIILHTLGTGAYGYNLFADNKRKIAGRMRDTQCLMSFLLGPDAPYWDDLDGIYRLERDDTPGSGIGRYLDLPKGACMVFFPGSEHKPWLEKVREDWPWVETYWPDSMVAA